MAVYNMMSWAGDTPPEGWNRTRHVIILMTDGQKGSLLPDSPPSHLRVALQSTCNIRLMVGAPSSNRPDHVDLSCDILYKEGLCDLSLPNLPTQPHPLPCEQAVCLDPPASPHGPSPL